MLRLENGFLKRRFATMARELGEKKDEMTALGEKEKELHEAIAALSKDVQGHKKEIRERDETIADKEARIYDLKKKNQVRHDAIHHHRVLPPPSSIFNDTASTPPHLAGAGEVQVRAELQDPGAEAADHAPQARDPGHAGADEGDGTGAAAVPQVQRGAGPHDRGAETEARRHAAGGGEAAGERRPRRSCLQSRHKPLARKPPAAQSHIDEREDELLKISRDVAAVYSTAGDAKALRNAVTRLYHKYIHGDTGNLASAIARLDTTAAAAAATGAGGAGSESGRRGVPVGVDVADVQRELARQRMYLERK